ncbi:MAG: HD domain-containing phosphohydrolase [bacterium]
MNTRVLFVDDDPNILAAFKRQLYKDFEVYTALGGEQGLELLKSKAPFSVVVADMSMPGMDGITFLTKVKEMAPDAVRIMLTGHSTLDTAVAAVNEGNIFRFLTKPCPPELLLKTLKDGERQYKLVTAERELVEQTLRRSIQVLTEVLSMVNPTAFGRASRVHRLVKQICDVMQIRDRWQIEIAAMLSQIGCVIVPEETLIKAYSASMLTESEQEMFQSHVNVGKNLVGNIPRLEEVAEIIWYQEKLFDGTGIPTDSKRGEAIPLGSRILKVALDYDSLIASGKTPPEACLIMETREGWYDRNVLLALEEISDLEKVQEIRFVTVEELSPGMVLADDVLTSTGVLLVKKGQEIVPSLKMRLLNYKKTRGLREPIKVAIHEVTVAVETA